MRTRNVRYVRYNGNVVYNTIRRNVIFCFHVRNYQHMTEHKNHD